MRKARRASRQRSGLCKSPGVSWAQQGSPAFERRSPMERWGQRGDWTTLGGFRKGRNAQGSTQRLKSTALAENQTLSRASCLVPMTAGIGQARGRGAGLGCLGRWGQRSFHTRSNVSHLWGPCHAPPLLKVTDPECLAS